MEPLKCKVNVIFAKLNLVPDKFEKEKIYFLHLEKKGQENCNKKNNIPIFYHSFKGKIEGPDKLRILIKFCDIFLVLYKNLLWTLILGIYYLSIIFKYKGRNFDDFLLDSLDKKTCS